MDPAAAGGLGGIGTIPPGVSELAAGAMRGLRPTLESALVLERFFRENYRRAVGPELPTGHGWPQLREFLLESKRGTSEQFATAYVVLARSVGIPARVVVGYRLPAGRNADGGYTVRNGDVFAWPEVAVKGAGWVPLDPGGGAAATGAGPASGASALAAKARASLPPSEQLRDPPVAPPEPGGAGQPVAGSSSFRFPVGTVLIVLGALAAVVLAGVPGAKAVRARRRRRRSGAASVLGAYEEVRDRLRDHRIPVTDGMTVRDYAGLVPDPVPLRTLASLVDSALWTGQAGRRGARGGVARGRRRPRRTGRERGRAGPGGAEPPHPAQPALITGCRSRRGSAATRFGTCGHRRSPGRGSST